MIFRKSRNFYWVLFAVGFALNLVWELGQMQYFTALSEIGYPRAVLFCTLASVVDGVAVVSIFFVLENTAIPELGYYPFAAFFGGLTAVLFELVATKLGLWAYAPDMPEIPFIKVGLLPFIQLLILVPASIFVTNISIERKK
ncbi:MAG: hypothetical protein HKN33_07590 [Pyrinomonadaceae bacterium]|nr:hypothetical protein [Pyrinomonadaceae bacterium]